jgi:hypothetical protein
VWAHITPNGGIQEGRRNKHYLPITQCTHITTGVKGEKGVSSRNRRQAYHRTVIHLPIAHSMALHIVVTLLSLRTTAPEAHTAVFTKVAVTRPKHMVRLVVDHYRLLMLLQPRLEVDSAGQAKSQQRAKSPSTEPARAHPKFELTP